MNEAIKLLQSFYETFEQNIKNGLIEEASLKIIEANKIKILVPFLQAQSHNSKYIKLYVTKVWNYCRMLNYVRNIKDTDHNYSLLRIKDFICDLFFTLFSSFSNEITLQDTFNLLQLVTEIGRTWLSIHNALPNQIDGWMKKIDAIMKYLIVKVSEVETLVNIDRKYYQSLIDYLNFYIEAFLLSKPNPNPVESLVEEITKILFLIKNIQFVPNDNETRNLVINLIEVIQKEESDKRLLILDAFNELKHKINLPHQLIADLYQYYLTGLIERNQTEKGNEIVKEVLSLIQPNTREEIEYFILHLYLLIKTTTNNDDKTLEIIEVLFEHKELSIEDIESIIIKLSSYKSEMLVFMKAFAKRASEMRSLKFANTKIVFSYENIKKHPNFALVFLYALFDQLFLSNQLNQDEVYMNSLLTPSLFDLIKNASESLLDNFISENYAEEYSGVIPSLFENVITLFLKYENKNESFANYFLIEIIRRGKASQSHLVFWKYFTQISLDIYIEKKDYPKLKAIISELEELNEFNCQFYYSKIVLIIAEGIKWNTVNIIQSFCIKMNSSTNFDIISYMKLFNMIYDCNVNDINLFSILVMNFSMKYCEMLNDGNQSLNGLKGYALLDCFYQVIYYSTKVSDLTQHIVAFSEVFELISAFIEMKRFDSIEQSKAIASSFSLVVDLIKLVLDVKALKSQSRNNNHFNYPEFILISLCKITNYVFINFDLFLCELTLASTTPLSPESLSSIVSLFELYQTLKIFYVSCEYANSSIDENKLKLQEKYNHYQGNLMTSLKLLITAIGEENTKRDIDNQIRTMINGSKTIEQILQIQIMLKANRNNSNNSNDSIQNHILKLVNDNYANKKLIFVTNSILYQLGYKELSAKFVSQLLNIILVENTDLVNKVYSIEEILSLFKDYVNAIDNSLLSEKISALKEYQVFVCKLYGKTDDSALCDNIEWIHYKIYQLLEDLTTGSRNNKEVSTVTRDFISSLKEIFGELNALHIRNKPIVTIALVDLIITKFI